MAEIYGKLLEEMKKIDEFKKEIDQKFAAIALSMPAVNFREIDKKLTELTKATQNLNNKFNKDTESSKKKSDGNI